MSQSAARRAAMVESQLRTNDVTDPRILIMIGEIERERFVPPAMVAVAYMEGCVPLGHGRALPDARSFGKLLQLASVLPTDRVLDVGCTTGYSTRVIAGLAGHVTGLEEDPELAHVAAENLANARVANAEIVCAKLSEGWPEKAPFDVIFLNGAIEVMPQSLLDQLDEGGRLVCVKREGAAGHGCIYLKHDWAVGKRAVFEAQLPVLPGFNRVAGFVF